MRILALVPSTQGDDRILDPARQEWFATTHWSVILAAGGPDSPSAAAALEKLCRTYWQPLYTFIRRQGHGPHDAQDLTQGFFAWLLGSRQLAAADSARGRFRSLLLALLKNFLSDQRRKAQAQKRGGGRALISIDAALAEERHNLEPATHSTPELSFDRCWASTVLDQTVARLREEYAAAGRSAMFDELKHFQPGEESDRSYSDAARRLGLTESAVKSAIWRLRKRHGQLLREEIAHTVATPAEVDEEIRYLIAVLTA